MDIDLTLDRNRQFIEESLSRERMGDIAERVLVLMQPAILRELDSPADHILSIMIARGKAEHLRHALGWRVVVITGGVQNPDPHGRATLAQSMDRNGTTLVHTKNCS